MKMDDLDLKELSKKFQMNFPEPHTSNPKPF